MGFNVSLWSFFFIRRMVAQDIELRRKSAGGELGKWCVAISTALALFHLTLFVVQVVRRCPW